MSRYNNKTTSQRIALLGIDVLFIVFFILFFDIEFMKNGIMNLGTMERTMNIVPFVGIKKYFIELGTVEAIKYLVTTAALFTTIGVFASVFTGKNTILALIIVLAFTLSIEIFQFCGACDVADIDDFIVNTCGGFIGIIMDKLILSKIDKLCRARIVTFSFLLLAGGYTIYSNYTLDDFRLNATTEVYNEWMVESLKENCVTVDGKCVELTNDKIVILSKGNETAYRIYDNTPLIIKKEKREYNQNGITKHIIVVYEELTRSEFSNAIKNNEKELTLYIDGKDKVATIQLNVN